jgi:hypothetical protein
MKEKDGQKSMGTKKAQPRIIEIKSLSSKSASRFWRESWKRYLASPGVARAETNGRKQGLPGY